MYKGTDSVQKDSAGWVAFVWISFAVAVVTTTLGIYVLPVDWWVKGYIGMGFYFSVASSITLSKTVRDDHEATKLINQINEAKTKKLLTNFEKGGS